MGCADRLRHWAFDERIMLAVIMLNTAMMFIDGFFTTDSLLMEVCDVLFTLIFVFEAVVKISVLGWRGYWHAAWNRFDFIVLLIALPSLAGPFLQHSMATSTILALRSMRLFKSLKMFQFIPKINSLLNGVRLAMKSSFLVIVAFVLFLVIFSILSSTIFGKVAPGYFSNPAMSIYSLFRLFTIEGWYEIPDTIAENGGSWWGLFARCYFSVLVFCGGIIGMSLINSIFVDAMAGDNNDEVLEKLSKIEERLKDIEKRL